MGSTRKATTAKLNVFEHGNSDLRLAVTACTRDANGPERATQELTRKVSRDKHLRNRVSIRVRAPEVPRRQMLAVGALRLHCISTRRAHPIPSWSRLPACTAVCNQIEFGFPETDLQKLIFRDGGISANSEI